MTETRQSIDLAAYFARIGYAGAAAPTLATLQELVRLHSQTIPFENLSTALGQVPALDLAALERKLVQQGRGGYCFEQNRLLQQVLAALGFATTDLLARVMWNMAPDALNPRSHMVLRVEVADVSYLVDVGFGALTPTAPLRLERDTPQTTPLETMRLVAGQWAELRLEGLIGQDWRPVYEFDLTPQYPIDYVVANWYVATNPTSHFVTSLLAARPAEGRRYGLRNRQRTIRWPDGRTEQRTLSSIEQLARSLEDDFLIRLPDDPALEPLLERIIALPVD